MKKGMTKLTTKRGLSLKYSLRSVLQVIRGLIKALRLGRYWFVSWRIQSKWRKLENEDRFDESYGTETSKQHFILNYGATPVRTFNNIMQVLPVSVEDFIFIDLGSGKGRVLLLASKYPFKRIIGVEHVPDLNKIAQNNLDLYLEKTVTVNRIELYCQDAVSFVRQSWPVDNVMLFMFCPFSAAMVKEVCTAIHGRLADSRKTIIIAFVNPKQAMVQVLETWGSLKLLYRQEADDPDLFVYQSYQIFSNKHF